MDITEFYADRDPELPGEVYYGDAEPEGQYKNRRNRRASPMDITEFYADRGPELPGKVYYGDAEPEGQTVVVGGGEVTVGGWAAYEITRRRARWEADPRAGPGGQYPGRRYVGGQDVLESLFAPGPNAPPDPLSRAATRLAAAVKALGQILSEPGGSAWERLRLAPEAPIVVPPLSPADVEAAIPETDAETLGALAEDVEALVAGYCAARDLPLPAPPPPSAPLPPLPRRMVSTADGAAVARLEETAAPRARALEIYRGGVAAFFDAAAEVLEELTAE